MLFEDEFSLSNAATLHYQWSPVGQQPEVPVQQSKKERKTAFGSLNYETGQVTVHFSDNGNTKTFIRHLQKVLKIYPQRSKIIMVVDNVPFHHSRRMKRWLENHPRLELVFLPPYSPELNPIERVWWYMRKKITHNRFVRTMKERKAIFWRMFSHFQKANEEIKQVCVVNY